MSVKAAQRPWQRAPARHRGVDLQPCGGTHVRNTAEIGKVVVTKIENKGRQNRRIIIGLPERRSALRGIRMQNDHSTEPSVTSAPAPRIPVRRRSVLHAPHALRLDCPGVARARRRRCLLLPGYLKGVAVEQIREQLHREATVESITVNPLLMSVRVKALAINDSDGKSSLLTFDELYTRIGLRSILRGAPVIEELALVKPRINLARLAEERYNVSDIVELMLGGPPNPQGPRFALNSLSISDAEIVFDDRPAGAIHKIEKLRIDLPVLSSFEDERKQFAEPTLSAVVNGKLLELKGKTKPFDASLETIVNLHLSDVDIPRYLGYSPVRLPVRLDKGSLSSALDIVIVRAKDMNLSASVKGTLRLDGLLLRDADGGDSTGPVAALRSIDVKIGELKWPDNTLMLDSVAIDGPQVWVRREKNGTINWQEMLARLASTPAQPAAPGLSAPIDARNAPKVEVIDAAVGAAAAPKPVPARPAPTAPFRFTIADAKVTDGLVLFEDFAAPAGLFTAVTRPIAVHARNVSNVDGAEAAMEISLTTDGDEQIMHTGTLVLAPFAAAGEVSVKRARLARYQPYFGDTLTADLDG
jgi:hypothetical protein